MKLELPTNYKEKICLLNCNTWQILNDVVIIYVLLMYLPDRVWQIEVGLQKTYMTKEY